MTVATIAAQQTKLCLISDMRNMNAHNIGARKLNGVCGAMPAVAAIRTPRRRAAMKSRKETKTMLCDVSRNADLIFLTLGRETMLRSEPVIKWKASASLAN